MSCLRSLLLTLCGLGVLITPAAAYKLDGGPYWPDGNVILQLKLGSSPSYLDGFTPNGTGEEAAKAWNPYMGRVQLATNVGGTGKGGNHNSTNEVFFSGDIYGTAFGTDVLAVTGIWGNSTRRTESDVIVNSAEKWNAYRGSLRSDAVDLRRVLIHEFGHVLGLDHTDSYPSSIMYPYIGNIEVPTADDQSGVAVLYGYGTANPPIPPHLPSNLPFDATVTEGQSVDLYVSVNWDDSPPITYQWRKDGVDLPGATGAHYTLTSAALTDAGSYSVVVTNPGGSATSRSAKLTVNPAQPPQVATGSPADITGTVGKSATFYVNLSAGSEPFTFQWRKNGMPIPGATEGPLHLPSLALADAGLYSVVVSNRAGSATSREARLVVDPATLPTVRFYSERASAYLGGPVDIYPSVSGGTEPFTYQWEKDGVAIPGATLSFLGLSHVTAAQAGVYTVVVTNAAGSVRSTDTVTLTVLPGRVPPEAKISFYSSSYALQCESFFDDGSYGTFGYQWYRNGQPITGATASGYTLPTAQRTEPAEYVVVMSNTAGSTASLTYLYTPPVETSGTTTGGWLAAERLGDIAYFLFANPARIERYDLAQATWLTSLTLPRTPTCFRPHSTGLIVAFGKSVSRFNADGTVETPLVTVDYNVSCLLVRSGILYVFYQQDTTYAWFRSVRLSDNTVLDTFASHLVWPQPRSLALAPTLGRIVGRGSSNSPSDLFGLNLNADGTFGTQASTPARSVYADCRRTFVSPDEQLLFEDNGTFYRMSDLAYAGSLDRAYDDLAFAADGSPVILSGGRLVAYDTKLLETGQLPLSGAPTRLFLRGQTAFTFEPPASSGTTTTVRQVTLDQLKVRTPWARVSAEGLSYAPSEIVCGADQVVYLLSRAHGNVFRWSVAQGRYLDSLPLLGAPRFLTATADAAALYLAYADQRITRLAVASGSERPFLGSASSLLGLAMVGDRLFYSDGRYYTFDGEGRMLASADLSSRSAAFVWNAPKHRIYHFQDNLNPNDLIRNEIEADGSIGENIQYHSIGEKLLRYPIRVSPDGGNVLLGSGVFFDADSLKQNNALPVAIDDAVWLGSRLYTARNTLDGVRLERWGGNNYGRDASGTLTGRLLRLFALADNRLLAVVQRNNAPAFVLLDPDLNGADPTTPLFTSQPSAVNATAGTTARLSATVAGGSLTYQWRKDGVDLPGANSATLTLSSLGTADVGRYTVVARNAAGVTQSSTVSVTLANYAFAGSAVGTFPGGAGEFALAVRADGATALIGRLTASQQAIVATGLKFAADGSFMWSPPTDGLRGAAADTVRFFSGAIEGRIVSGSLTLTIPSLQLSATATYDPGSRTAEDFGFFQAVPVNRSTGELFVIRGVDGRAFVLDLDAGAVRSTIVSVSTGGALNVTLGAGLATPTTYVGSLAAGGFRGTATPSSGVAVNLVPPPALPGFQRLANISSRGVAGAGEKVLTAGFVITGSDPKDVLIRAVGPTLGSLGVAGTLANPSLTIFRAGTQILANDDWGTAPNEISNAAARVGAISLTSGSRDSAILTRLSPGLYTTQVGLNNGSPGVAMIEVYDAGSSDSAAPKVVNISTRADVGLGDNILIAGFVVNGDAPKKILVRGVGPGLTPLGVGGALVDPQIKLFAGATPLAQNDNWSAGADQTLIAAAASKVGAFALPAGSKDAALLLYLSPGLYTVHLSGVNDTTGIAMVEVYEVSD